MSTIYDLSPKMGKLRRYIYAYIIVGVDSNSCNVVYSEVGIRILRRTQLKSDHTNPLALPGFYWGGGGGDLIICESQVIILGRSGDMLPRKK